MRRERDFYETAPWQVDALVDNLPELSGTIWCPCVGDGSLMRRLMERRPDLQFITNDIDEAKDALFHVDAATAEGWEYMRQRTALFPCDWVVDNPLFNVELPIAQNAYEHARRGVPLSRARMESRARTPKAGSREARGCPRTRVSNRSRWSGTVSQETGVQTARRRNGWCGRRCP